MGQYLPVIIWVISAFIFHMIAKKRHVRETTFRILLVVLLGPLAIPLAYLFKPEP